MVVKNKDLPAVGRELRRLRVSRELDQSKVGGLVGFCSAYISDIEIGRARPTIRFIEKFIKALVLNHEESEVLRLLAWEDMSKFSIEIDDVDKRVKLGRFISDLINDDC